MARAASKKVKKDWEKFKKSTKGKLGRGDVPNSKVPKRDASKAGDSVSSLRPRKSGPNKGKTHPMREYRGPDRRVHSAPATKLPKNQMKGRGGSKVKRSSAPTRKTKTKRKKR